MEQCRSMLVLVSLRSVLRVRPSPSHVTATRGCISDGGRKTPGLRSELTSDAPGPVLRCFQVLGMPILRISIFLIFKFFLFAFLGPLLQDMEVPRLGVDLHHSSWQRQILNPLSKTRDPACIPMDPSQVRYH